MSAPKLVNLPAFDVAGTSVRTSNVAEQNPATAQIGDNWQRFFADGHHERIPKASDKLLGVYTDYESDHEGPYSQIVGCETTTVDDLADGLVAVRIPEQDYLVFRVEGEMPMAVIEAWGRIMAHFTGAGDYERAYTADFELYQNESTVDIHIAVRAKN
ncbi:MAG: effector binding domain-containing protein [Bacteroidetes bacterium]|nr:effector binding domain-containing protein [Bacteroidota bacterium]